MFRRQGSQRSCSNAQRLGSWGSCSNSQRLELGSCRDAWDVELEKESEAAGGGSMVLHGDRTQMRCQRCGPRWGPLVTQRPAVGRRLPAAPAERCLSTLLLIRLPVGASWWRTLRDLWRRAVGVGGAAVPGGSVSLRDRHGGECECPLSYDHAHRYGDSSSTS